jgi:AcrR family transcriptional regulator
VGRDYRMSKRAQDVAQTRQRIVDATTELHGAVGPARTTVSAIAELAGVTRLTVYRHFPDEEALFGACSANWYAQQPHRPDPLAWQAIADPQERLRTALAEVYAFYRYGARTLSRIYADWEALPAEHRAGMVARNAGMRDVLLAPFGRAPKRLRAVVGHALAFPTWQSLCLEHGLSDREAVEAMTDLVLATAGSRAARP